MKLRQLSRFGIPQSGSSIVLRCSLLLAAALALPACGHRTSLSKAPEPAGVYSLVSVNGKPVPATVSHDGANLEVRSGTFTIGDDGTCLSKILFVPPTGAEVLREVKATYTQAGSELTMRWERAGVTKGTVAGDTFTMNNEGMIFAYRK